MRRIPLSYGSHITGFRPTGHGVIGHESALERDFVTLEQFLDPGARIRSQPVTIPYDDGGKRRRYTPDFEIVRSGGEVEIVEVKYRAALRRDWGMLRPKFIAARNYANRLGGIFRIATERSIRCAMLENAKRLLPLRNTSFDAEMAQAIIRAVKSGKRLTVGDVLAGVSGDRAESLSTVWRLIAAGRLMVDLRHPITPSTMLAAQ